MNRPVVLPEQSDVFVLQIKGADQREPWNQNSNVNKEEDPVSNSLGMNALLVQDVLEGPVDD